MSASWRTVHEVPTEDPPGFTHPGWAERFPWLVQGTTGRGGEPPFDLALFGAGPGSRVVLDRWTSLRGSTGCPRAVHAHQVHGAAVRFHGPGPPGLFIPDPCDGHATAERGVLLTVTVADCVPVSVIDARTRAIELLHAGWRSAAAGILRVGVELLRDRLASRPADLHVHFGPSICGSCYEVGPEVFDGLGLPVPDGPRPVDLRKALAEQALALGIPPKSISVSERCTRCDDGPGLFSHRGGDAGRQVGYLGIRR